MPVIENIVSLLSALGMATACMLGSAPVTSAGQQVAGGAAPVIRSINPSSGPAGVAYPTKVTLTGTGFTASGNTVLFGGIELPDLPSEAGKIVFVAPKERSSGGEVPPMVMPRGVYPVSVVNRNGRSNSVDFMLTD
ncbi:hypothetical protein CSC94_08515 [Zhengella mangrovi]|uniref:IPT/TIG domain-containing protein n=1 Tax=Zhengella mangrovi TaxID=1982044 RepID=A0A2G1QQJ7_9HYPH|nr:IPT/TIG domain-containing protein [Zhengella mangrovi]PHP67724.1 hypothetical protein CSC94_08515 [Zhengella mangrovi]